MGKKYKLTISLLASNRKDTLPKCLESLKPILDNVSSELIVVDTGCDEELVEIIKKYTDKVEKFTWCNDFAKARNVGVDKAQGEWFMFIDDDEWFEDVSEIIDFFNSAEEKKYGFAKYIVRNYNNRQGTKWEDAVVGRIFRLRNNARFKGAVHEYIQPAYGPTKAFGSYVHHYGYVYDTMEERIAHVNRNKELILKEIEKNPTKSRYYAHLYQEFSMLDDYDNSMKYTMMALENIDLTDEDNRREMNSTYANHIYVLMHQKKYEEAIEAGEGYMGKGKLSKLAQAAISGFIAVAAMVLKDYHKSIAYTDKFYAIKQYYDKNIDKYYEDAVAMIDTACDDENVSRILSAGLKSATELGDVEKTYEYVRRFKWSDMVYMVDGSCIGKIADLSKKCADMARNVKIFDLIGKQKTYFDILIRRIMEIKLEDYEHFLHLCNIVADIEVKSGYVQMMKIIAADRNQEIEKLSLLYQKAIDSIIDIMDVDEEFFEIALRRQIDINSMLLKKPVSKWISGVEQWIAGAKIKEVITKKGYLDKLISADSLQMKYLNIRLMEYMLMRRKIENLDLNTLVKELHNLAVAEIEYYKNIYTQETFDKWQSLLPKGVQAALKILEVEKLIIGGDIEAATEVINNISEIQPTFEKVLLYYKEKLLNCR